MKKEERLLNILSTSVVGIKGKIVLCTYSWYRLEFVVLPSDHGKINTVRFSAYDYGPPTEIRLPTPNNTSLLSSQFMEKIRLMFKQIATEFNSP